MTNNSGVGNQITGGHFPKKNKKTEAQVVTYLNH
jgi:hypothetical protein